MEMVGAGRRGAKEKGPTIERNKDEEQRKVKGEEVIKKKEHR